MAQATERGGSCTRLKRVMRLVAFTPACANVRRASVWRSAPRVLIYYNEVVGRKWILGLHQHDK